MELLFGGKKKKSHKLLELCIVANGIKPAKWQLFNYLNIWGTCMLLLLFIKLSEMWLRAQK